MPAQTTCTLRLNVIYNANGGSGGPSYTGYDQETVTTADLPYTLSVQLAYTTPSRTGYTFQGWSVSSSASSASYQPGDTYSYTFYDAVSGGTTTHDTTMYAVWKKRTYTVAYKKGANGTGTEVNDTKTYGVALTLRGAIFTRTNYEQVGWSTTDGGAQEYSLGASYTANAAITLYPVWKKLTYAYVKVGGAWKEAQIYVKTGGAWKEVTGAYVKVSGTWKPT